MTSPPDPPSWAKKVTWAKGDILDPSSYNAHLESATAVVHTMGILLEADYPHQDGTWPDTQEIVRQQIGTFAADDIRKLTWENASRLFDHPVPEAVQADPDAY